MRILVSLLFAALISGVVAAPSSANDVTDRYPIEIQQRIAAASAGLALKRTAAAQRSYARTSRRARRQLAAAETHGGYVKRGAALGYEPQARNSVRAIIARHAARNGVPFALADAVVRIESRYHARVSNGGAVGLMQIKPATARGVGFHGSARALYNPETNIAYGMRYLAAAYRMSGGNTCLTVMRYQSGHYARRMNAANRAYCGKARAIMRSV
ncbi:MAG: transglycosylase SLT domain-containing protein [Hyphomicrobiales bacterium]|nr:transglycosylase SLT domain-containing protein [Hyphomicrobiales bacterium]